MNELEAFKFISCGELKNRSTEEKIKYIKLYSNEDILCKLSTDWRSNFYFLFKSIDANDIDLTGKYDETFIFRDSLELVDIKKECSIEIEKIMRNIVTYYIALVASLNDYNQEMAEHLNDFYFNYFLTANMSDISYIFNFLFYSQKQGEEGNKSRMINMNNIKHIKNSVYLFNSIQKNSRK